MSKKQYVHRDVSSGNILIVDGKGKLVDLEYAQIINTGVTTALERYVSMYGIPNYLPILYSGNNCLHGSGGRKRLLQFHYDYGGKR
jgi:serine/threonine protein kinase